MPKPLPLIQEREEALWALFNTIHDRERRNRMHALFLAKMGYCQTRHAMAQALHIERKAGERWFRQYAQHGLQALITSHRHHGGKNPRIQGDALVQLHEKLEHPEGFLGYQRICTWLKEQFGLDVPYKTVHTTVYYRLNGRPKVPRKSHVQQDPHREEVFKKNICRPGETSPAGQS
jgi:transposase